MGEVTHTPGPWSVREGDSVVYVFAGDGLAVAATNRKPYWQRHDETDLANARLIAAAPELLDALDGILAHVGNIDPDASRQTPYEKALIAGRALIAHVNNSYRGPSTVNKTAGKAGTDSE